MNDWNDKDNFPTDDDDFSWMNEDDNDLNWLNDSEENPEELDDAPNEWQMPRPERAERDIAAQMEEAEAADFGDTDNFLDWMNESDESDQAAPAGDIPDWLSDMDLPEASEEEMAEAAASVLGDKFGDEQEEDAFAWSSEESPEEEGEEDAFGWSSEEEAEEEEGISSDSLLFGTSASADDEVDSFLMGQGSSDDDADSFLFSSSAGDEEEDSFLFGSSSDEEEEPIAKPSSPLGSEWGQVGSSWTGEMPAVPDDAEDAGPGSWSVLDDEEFGEEDPAFSSLFGAESSSVGSDDDLGVPDWLMGGEEEPSPAMQANDDDLGVPDWLMGADEDEEESQAPVAQEEDEFDFLSDLGEPVAVNEVDDLLGSLAGDDDDDDLGDLLASLDTEEDASVDDLLAALGGDEEEDDLDSLLSGLGETKAEAADFNAYADEEADPADDLDFLMDDEAELSDDLDFMEAVAADNDLDFLMDDIGDEAEFSDDLDFMEPVAADTGDDLDFLDSIGEEAETASDLDFLEPVAADTASDLDFLDSIGEEPETAGDLDFLDSIGEAEEQTGFYQERDNADLDFLDETEAAATEDWFGEEQVAAGSDLSFLDELPDNIEDKAEAAEDWLSAIDSIEAAKATTAGKEPSFNIDDLIDSFDEEGDEEMLIAPSADLDAIFGAMDADEKASIQNNFPEGAVPEWLRDVAQDTDESSAASIIRQRRDRSLEEMDDRLLALRESGLELTTETSETAEEHRRISKLVPNLEEGLVPIRVQPSATAIAAAPVLTPEKQKYAEVMTAILGSSQSGASSAKAGRLGRAFASIPLARWLISLILLAAVIAPFSLGGFGNLGILPPVAFETESPEYTAFGLVEGLEPENTVLFAAEYGATGARELDTASRAILEHIFVNGGKPVIVSSDAVGLLRAEHLAVELAGEERRNQAYYIAGFLPAGTLGLRDFALNVNLTVSSDLQGNPTGLNLTSLNDFTLIVLIAENGETVRNWMEQIAPMTDRSIIVISGQAARPLALPYVSSANNAVALLTGYDDAYTYQQMSLGVYNPSPTPTYTPTNTPTATSTPTATHTPTDTSTPTDTPIPSETPVPSDTATPSDTPEASPTDEASPTPELPTASPTVDALIEIATVISDTTANIRAGAGSNFERIAGAEPGTELRVIERSADNEWLRVVLPDGTEGWINISLVTVREIRSSEWDGTNSKGIIPVYMQVQDATTVPEGSIVIGRNGAGIDIPIYAEETGEQIIGFLPNRAEFAILGEEGARRTLIRASTTLDGIILEGYIESPRISGREMRLMSEVAYLATQTPIPSNTPMPSNTPSPTMTSTSTPTAFAPVLTPAPIENAEVRSASQSLGLVLSIAIIGIGNLFWIFRWLKQRDAA
jgi:hypothetical protein